jgi:hypothetical protein
VKKRGETDWRVRKGFCFCDSHSFGHFSAQPGGGTCDDCIGVLLSMNVDVSGAGSNDHGSDGIEAITTIATTS